MTRLTRLLITGSFGIESHDELPASAIIPNWNNTANRLAAVALIEDDRICPLSLLEWPGKEAAVAGLPRRAGRFRRSVPNSVYRGLWWVICH